MQPQPESVIFDRPAMPIITTKPRKLSPPKRKSPPKRAPSPPKRKTPSPVQKTPVIVPQPLVPQSPITTPSRVTGTDTMSELVSVLSQIDRPRVSEGTKKLGRPKESSPIPSRPSIPDIQSLGQQMNTQRTRSQIRQCLGIPM